MKKTLFAVLVAFSLGSLAGCASTMPAQLPEGFQVKPVARADAGAPFDVNRRGAFASLSKGEIEITDAQGKSVSIARGAASALSFSPSGDRVAAALPSGNLTLLRLLDGDGKVLGETQLTGRVTSVAWRSESEVLAGVLNVKKYSFGSRVTSRLFQWNGVAAPLATTLNDVTVRPRVGNLPDDVLYNQLIIAVSPYGDEIAYSTLKDPPLFSPYLKIVTRHLESGSASEVAQASLGAGKVVYTPDGDCLVIGDAEKSARRISIPEGKELESWPSAGSNPALSPSGSYVLLDGHLYQKGKEIATFPPEAKGVFLPDGSGLALSYQGRLYLVSGLKDRPGPALPADLDRVLKLRRLRSQGLITDQEYKNQKDKGIAP